MGSLARLCCVAVAVVAVVAAVVARPNGEGSQRDARGQTIVDSSDPVDKSRSMLVELSEAYKGGVVPVALVYDSPDNVGVSRPLRDVQKLETRHEGSDEEQGAKKREEVNDGERKEEMTDTAKQDEDKKVDVEPEKEARGLSKNSKLLDLEARENDENAEFGLGIQSRNKVAEVDDEQPIEKPFVYNIQPLSFYSSETKEEENIINYINKIKEMRENQIKFQASKEQEKEEKKPPAQTQKVEEAVVVDSDPEEENRPIISKVQHFEAVIKPMSPQVQAQIYSGYPQTSYPNYAGFAGEPYPYPYQQNIYPAYNQGPQTVYIPNPFADRKTSYGSANVRGPNDWFPIVINNPWDEIWLGLTNIVHYAADCDVKKAKKGRVAEDDQITEIELPSERSKLGGSKEESWPRVTRLKVRKGGVAIAGPGGIATAGSGGTAIVGPGGTAYTTREGTAVVGPGGRVVHVPGFPVYSKNTIDPSQEFIPPPGSRTVAEGPIIYYDNPLDQEDIPDPSIPI